LKIAIEERQEQAWAFGQLTSALPREDVDSWAQAVEEWESDSRNSNPFVTTVKCRLLLLSFRCASELI
jgi:hypothetical protein